MTVYYVVSIFFPRKEKSYPEGIYKVKGKWYNIVIDWIFSLILENRIKIGSSNTFCATDRVVDENIDFLMSEQYFKDILIDIGYKIKVLQDKYQFDEVFTFRIYIDDIYDITLNFNNEVGSREEIRIIGSTEDKSIDVIYILSKPPIHTTKYPDIDSLEKLRKFKTLKDFHKLLEAIE